MKIQKHQFYDLIDRVTHEGEPELLIGPLTQAPAVDLPESWKEALTARNPNQAVANLWRPMEDRLPRVCMALWERLSGVALLRTEQEAASLIYFFSDEDDYFKFRGRLPLDETSILSSNLPKIFLDFYRIHNGWVLYSSEDEGPLPSSEWISVGDCWEEIEWKIPPGEISFDDTKAVFRSEADLIFAFDTSVSPPRPLLFKSDGTVQSLADIWMAIDDEVYQFLEELNPKENVLINKKKSKNRVTARIRYEKTLEKLPERQVDFHCLSGEVNHQKLCNLVLERIKSKKFQLVESKELTHLYEQALKEWCTALENGSFANPAEVFDFFALAQALGNEKAALFIATTPYTIWEDDSIEAIKVRALFQLFAGNLDYAEATVEELEELTSQGAQAEDSIARGYCHLLESMCKKNREKYKEQRKIVFNPKKMEGKSKSAITADMKRIAFDSVAFRIGIIDKFDLSP